MPNAPNRTLKIDLINVCSMVSDVKKIAIEKHLRANRPDILMVNETWFRNCNKVRMNGYRILRTDRDPKISKAKGGGTAIFVSSDIEFSAIECDTPPKSFEYSQLEVQ